MKMNKKQIFYSVLIFLIVIDLFVPKSKEESLFFGQMLIGFMALYGFVSCVLIIVISKLLGYFGISKKEGYYDE